MKKEYADARNDSESIRFPELPKPCSAEQVLDTLAKSYESLHTVYDEPSTLKQIRKSLCGGLGVDIINIYYYEGGEGKYNLVDTSSILDIRNVGGISLQGISQDTGYGTIPMEKHPLSSHFPERTEKLIIVPMLARGIPIGMIEIAFIPHRQLAQHEVIFLKTLASMAGTSLERVLGPSQKDATDTIARNVLDSPNQYVLTVDLHGVTQMVNSAFTEFTGFTKDDIPSVGDWYKFLSNENYMKYKGMIRQIVSTSSSVSHMNSIYGGEGREAVVSWTNAPLYGASRSVIGVICIGHDVTSQYRLEKRLNGLYALMGKTAVMASERDVLAAACNMLYSSFDIDSVRVMLDKGASGMDGLIYADGTMHPDTVPSAWHEPYIDAVMRSGKPYSAHVSFKNKQHGKAPLFASPITIGESLGGVICVTFFSPHIIDDNEKNLILAVTDFISIALSNMKNLQDVAMGNELHSVISDSPNIHLIKLDADNRVEYANGTLLNALRSTRGELRSCGQMRSYLNEQDYSALIQEVNHVRLVDAPSAMMLPFSIKGESLVLSIEIAPYHDGQGYVAGTVIIGMDITELIELERQLQESYSFNASILDNVTMGICVCDSSRSIMRLNPACAEWFQKENDQVLGTCITDSMPLSLVGPFNVAFDTALKYGAVQSFELDIPISGTMGSYQIALVPYAYKPPKSIGRLHVGPGHRDVGTMRVITIIKDITTIRKTERELSENEQKLRSVFDNSCGGIMVITPSATESGDNIFIITDINLQALQLCNKPYDAVIGAPVADVLPQMEKTGLMDSIQNVAITGQSHEYDDFQCSSMGEDVFMQVSVFPAGSHVVLSMKNITDRVNSAAALKEKNNELERFVYHISHDLRSPITILQGMISILVEDYRDALGDDGTYCLSRISTNVERLDTYIRDLLKLSRADGGSYPIEIIDTAALVNEIVSAYTIKYPTASVTIGDLPRISYERELLTALFSVIIENAFVYSNYKERPIISISCTEREQDHIFFIEDNGIGIEPQYTKKIFKVFERLCDIDTPGTGIGLALAERIVSNHNGIIRVESTKGEGSTFSFTITKEEEDMHGI